MELLKFSKFKLQLQSLITEVRDLKVMISVSEANRDCRLFLLRLTWTLSGQGTLRHRATPPSNPGFLSIFSRSINYCSIRSHFSSCIAFCFVLIRFVMFESGSRSRSGMRKSVVERYRNCRESWLLSKKSVRNWRERFGEFIVHAMSKGFCFYRNKIIGSWMQCRWITYRTIMWCLRTSRKS